MKDFAKNMGIFLITRILGALAISFSLIVLAATVFLGLSIHMMM